MKNLKKWSIALSFLSGFFYFIPFLFPSFFFLSWFAKFGATQKLAIQGETYRLLILGCKGLWKSLANNTAWILSIKTWMANQCYPSLLYNRGKKIIIFR